MEALARWGGRPDEWHIRLKGSSENGFPGIFLDDCWALPHNGTIPAGYTGKVSGIGDEIDRDGNTAHRTPGIFDRGCQPMRDRRRPRGRLGSSHSRRATSY